jgi:hypothetical protein
MADLFGNLASGIGGLLGLGSGAQSTLNYLGDIGTGLGGTYDLYQGIQSQGMYQDYMSQLLGSTDLSDELLRKQATRAEDLYYPIEDLQAQYALEDIQSLRPLQTAQQTYGIQRGLDDISLAQDVVDPTRTGLITQLAQGADAQKYMDIASTDVMQAYDKSLGEAQRAYSQMGINPSSGAAQNLINQGALSRAASLAGARTEASRLAEDLDIQRKGQALDLFSGIPLTQTEAPQSGSSLSSQAAQGLQGLTSSLVSGANLANQAANTGFAGASAAFGNLTNYTNPTNQSYQGV